MFPLLFGLSLLQPASAGDIDQIRYLANTNQHRAAAAAATTFLDEDSTSFEVHYHSVMSQKSIANHGEIVRTYRAWLKSEPDNPAARYGLALSLSVTNDTASCDEIPGLLADLPGEGAYFSAALRYSQANTCDFDTEAIAAEVEELAPDTARARAWLARLAIRDGIDQELHDEIASLLAEDPSWVRRLWGAFVSPDSKWAKKTRTMILDIAETQSKSDIPTEVADAILIYRAAEKPDRFEPLELRLAELDPGYKAQEPRDPFETELMDAINRPTHEAVLSNLDALLKKAEGKQLAKVQTLRSWRLSAMGEDAAALEASQAAYLSDPENHRFANAFAFSAASHDGDLELALTAIEGALESMENPEYDADGFMGVEDWTKRNARGQSNVLDTKGWVLHKMGRHDEAVQVLTEALLFAESGVVAAHLGLALRAEDKELEAFELMAYAMSLGIDQPSLDQEVRATMADLYPKTGHWQPGGASEFAEIVATPVEDDKDEDDGADHALMGKAFPITEFKPLLKSKVASLSDLKGAEAVIVDMWATWCGPCVQAMPHLQAVTETYRDRGVRIVGLSVDAKPDEVDKFFRGVEAPAYDLAWIGKKGFSEAKINGIPSLFVLNADMEIVAYLIGYSSGDDKRLEEALDAIVGEIESDG